MSKVIDQLIESRIKKGNDYLNQNKVVMPIYEKFESNILTNLENNPENKDAFRAIKNRTEIIWTDIVDSMIRVYNTGSEYAEIKNLIVGEKSIQSDDRYGVYIFTDENDKINYVLAGSNANNDTVYVSEEAQNLLEERYDIVKEAKESLRDKFKIKFDKLPLGTKSKETSKENDVDLAEVMLKCVYDFICFAKNNVNHAGVTYDLNMPVGRYSVLNPNRYDTYFDAYNELSDITKRNYVIIAGKTYYINFKGNSTDWMNLRESYREHPEAYDVFSFCNKDCLRHFMALSLITVDISSDDSIVRNKYTVSDVYRDSEADLKNTYDDLYNKPLRNSIIYNMSIQVGDKPKDLKRSKEITRFEQLHLIPDKISHLYKIQQDVNDRGIRGKIEDFDADEFIDDDPLNVVRKLKSDTAVTDRRKNFDSGIRPRPSDRFSDHYTPADKNFRNIGGNQKRALDTFHSARRASTFGQVATKQEREANLSQLRRDYEWAYRQIAIGNNEFFNIQRSISDLRTSGTIEVEDVIDTLDRYLRKATQGSHIIAKFMQSDSYMAIEEALKEEDTATLSDFMKLLKEYFILAKGINNGNGCVKEPGIDESKFYMDDSTDILELATAYYNGIVRCAERMDELVNTLTDELSNAKNNNGGQITINGVPLNIKYTRIPQVKFRKVFDTFADTYDSVKNNTFGEFENILQAYKDYYVNNNGNNIIFCLNPLINFYASMTALMEFLNNIISYGTFGNMSEEEFVKMIYDAHDTYEKYLDTLYDLTDAYDNNDDSAVENSIGELNTLTKNLKKNIKDIGKTFELDTASYEENAKKSFSPNDFIPNYTRTVKN